MCATRCVFFHTCAPLTRSESSPFSVQPTMLMLIIVCLISVCSAKQLVRGEPNVSYICSRYYRAPELIFGATDYTSSIGGPTVADCQPEDRNDFLCRVLIRRTRMLSDVVSQLCICYMRLEYHCSDLFFSSPFFCALPFLFRCVVSRLCAGRASTRTTNLPR